MKNRLDFAAGKGQTGVSHLLLNIKWTAPRVQMEEQQQQQQRDTESVAADADADADAAQATAPAMTTTTTTAAATATTTTAAATTTAATTTTPTTRARTWGDYLRDPETFKLFTEVERLQHDVRQNRVCVLFPCV